MNIHCGRKKKRLPEVNIDCEHFLGGWVNIHCGRENRFPEVNIDCEHFLEVG